MKHLLAAIFVLTSFVGNAQSDFYKKILRRATFYSAVNGGNSVSDQDVYSIATGPLVTEVVETPFDYSLTVGVRKIARFGYENRANIFYDGTEKTYGDAATVGKYDGFEFLAEADWRRQQGRNFLDQDYFVRYVANRWIVKAEWLQDGFADVKYFEASQRARVKIGKKLSLNVGVVQRISEPYGYDPLQQWLLDNNQIHYTALALQQGYTADVGTGEFFDPNGEVVANDPAVWEQVVIPNVLDDYVAEKRAELTNQWVYSAVIGFDFYHYTKDFWLHSWGNVMPYHLDTGDEYSYHNFVNSSQWMDMGAGLVFGTKLTKSLGVFAEGRYNRYWNREWHDFSVGLNYILL
jgi:hypothetical protein|tara:strand:+ start:103 stop:1149 length:1047 start_codon:yes stop_codon:yes gene_type:complete